MNFELRLANRNLWKCVLKKLGVIDSDRVRGPMPSYRDDVTQRQFMNHVARVDAATFGVPVQSRRASPVKRAGVKRGREKS